MKTEQAYILMTGNPLTGLVFDGPYPNPEAAAEAGYTVDAEWWVVALQPTIANEEAGRDILLAVSLAEHGTIMAALRYYQEQGMGEPANRSAYIHDLATPNDETSLDSDGIDTLCEHLND